MKFSGLQAVAEITGPRLRVWWSWTLLATEKLADVPSVQLKRKQLDYEFPDPPASPDPFLIYDSAAFPAPGTVSTTVSTGEAAADNGRVSEDVESVSNGSEVLRRTLTVRTNSDGTTMATVSLIDSGADLTALVTYYYELRLTPAVPIPDPRVYRASATSAGRYLIGRTMYGMLPEMYRRHDVSGRPQPALPGIVEPENTGGQLQRFLEVTGATADFLRSRAEGLLGISDLHTADARMLPLLASWIGWNLDFRAAIPEQRHEIRYAAALYRLTGTIPGCMIWVRRLTGWDGRIKEFGRNVFFSNDTGNPEDPTGKGSFTLDTSDPKLLAAMKTFDDNVDYTYDSGTTNDDWYSYNTVGIFLKPSGQASAAEASKQMNRLLANLAMFLPVNVRGVVVLDIPSQTIDATSGYALLNTGEL